ncbi:hypothetical protein BDV10DRAFT_95017 [Aspergillus recurvatus]
MQSVAVPLEKDRRDRGGRSSAKSERGRRKRRSSTGRRKSRERLKYRIRGAVSDGTYITDYKRGQRSRTVAIMDGEGGKDSRKLKGGVRLVQRNGWKRISVAKGERAVGGAREDGVERGEDGYEREEKRREAQVMETRRREDWRSVLQGLQADKRKRWGEEAKTERRMCRLKAGPGSVEFYQSLTLIQRNIECARWVSLRASIATLFACKLLGLLRDHASVPFFQLFAVIMEPG